MVDIWLISDTHFGHANFLTFQDLQGHPVRPFASCEEMDETMIARWNAVVKPQDHVYHLGDFTLMPATRANVIAKRLNGIKRLVRGNHDKLKSRQYLAMGFHEIHGLKLLFDVWLTHAPIHPLSMGRALGNAHGHIHERVYEGPYVNCCVERTDYTPIHFERVRGLLGAKETLV
jgi:calcineurin-like phosphoesterase family protein